MSVASTFREGLAVGFLRGQQAQAYVDAATAAAEASGDVNFYDTKADADAALAGLSNLAIVEVFADESRSGQRTRYRKESGSYVFKLTLSPAVIGSGAYRFGVQYSTIDATVGGSWAFDGTASYPNKLGVNNTKPVDEPATGARTADASYVSGGADVAATIAGYDNVNNALAGLIASQHSMLYTGADHASIWGGSLHTCKDDSDYAFIAGGTSNTIEERGRYGAIIGGDQCRLVTGASDTASGFRGLIMTSSQSTIAGRNSSIVGSVNCVVNGTATYVAIENGETITVSAGTHIHVGGANNTVGGSAPASYSLIHGEGITCNGSRNLIVGDGHTSAFDYSAATGTKCIVPFAGARVHGSRHRGSVAGRNQTLDFQCSQETTDTTVTRLSVSGSATYPTQPADSIVSGFVLVNAANTATGACSAFRIDFVSERIGTGTPTLRQNATTTSYNGLALGTVPTMNVTSGGIYRVQVVGLAATNIAWDCRVACQQTVWTA